MNQVAPLSQDSYEESVVNVADVTTALEILVLC